ncbi:MAG: hypothetical protein OHK0047_27220 [Leptolyngbyaceae cyanobacterium]
MLHLNLFQLSLLSTLLFNAAIVLGSTAAKASEPILTESALAESTFAESSSQAESTPVLPIDYPLLENSPTASLPTSAEAPSTKATISSPDPPIHESTSLTPLTSPEVTPIAPNISKQASDLAGVNRPQSDAAPAIAQTETTPATESSSEAKPVNNPLIPPPGWRFDVEPYLFLPLDVKGNIFIGRGRPLFFPNRPGVILPTSGFNLGVNQNLSGITSKLTNIFGILGRIQAWNGNFGIVTDGVYVNSGFRSNTNGRTFTLRDQFEINIPGFEVDTKNTLASFSLAASYRVVTVPFRTITDPSNPSQYYPAISFEVLAGFRYLSVFQSVDFENGPNFEFSGSEFNPMLGGTVKLMLSNNFSLFFRGDTSNLGGGALKQYYNLYGGIDWKFSGSFALRLSYRFNQIEFVKQGRFGGDNGLNLRTQGVQLGLSWQF